MTQFGRSRYAASEETLEKNSCSVMQSWYSNLKSVSSVVKNTHFKVIKYFLNTPAFLDI